MTNCTREDAAWPGKGLQQIQEEKPKKADVKTDGYVTDTG